MLKDLNPHPQQLKTPPFNIKDRAQFKNEGFSKCPNGVGGVEYSLEITVVAVDVVAVYADVVPGSIPIQAYGACGDRTGLNIRYGGGRLAIGVHVRAAQTEKKQS